MKRGPWFPANVKPVHVGWYETKLRARRVYSDRTYWDGKRWAWTVGSGSGCVFQQRIWRGVLK